MTVLPTALLIGCNEKSNPQPVSTTTPAQTVHATAPAPAETDATPEPAADLVSLRGKVVHKPWSKSMESWNAGGSDYFVLELAPDQPAADGEASVILRPSEDVSRDELAAAEGKTVKVGGVRVPKKAYVPTSPMEQYPMGEHGKPAPRGGGLEVRTLEVEGN